MVGRLLVVCNLLSLANNQQSTVLKSHNAQKHEKNFVESQIGVIETYEANTSGRTKLTGKWLNYWGCNLSINPDSTFKFLWRFDMSASWTVGTWTTRGDTLILNKKIIWDTLRYLDTTRNQRVDSAILSLNDSSEIITHPLPAILSSGNQDYIKNPSILIFKNAKLYTLTKTGKIDKTKMRDNFRHNHKFPLWYVQRIE